MGYQRPGTPDWHACRFLQSEENREISENYDSFQQKEIVENIEFHEKYDFVKQKEKVEIREKVES